MSEWWLKYKDLVPGIEVFYPEENWVTLTSSTGLNLQTYRFSCEQPRGVLLLMHGLFGHASLSSHVAKRFAEASIVTVSFDFPHHGKSEGQHGTFPDAEHFVTDALTYLALIREAYPGLPVFVGGASLGGLVSVHVSLRDPTINGLVLLAPAMATPMKLEWLARPALRVAKFLMPNLRLPGSRRETASRNPYFVQLSDEDPLVFAGTLTIQSASSVVRLMKAGRDQTANVQVPMIVFQGGEDVVVSPEATRGFVEGAGSKDKNLVFIEAMRHVLAFEPNIYEMLGEMITWVTSRIH